MIRQYVIERNMSTVDSGCDLQINGQQMLTCLALFRLESSQSEKKTTTTILFAIRTTKNFHLFQNAQYKSSFKTNFFRQATENFL